MRSGYLMSHAKEKVRTAAIKQEQCACEDSGLNGGQKLQRGKSAAELLPFYPVMTV